MPDKKEKPTDLIKNLSSALGSTTSLGNYKNTSSAPSNPRVEELASKASSLVNNIRTNLMNKSAGDARSTQKPKK